MRLKPFEIEDCTRMEHFFHRQRYLLCTYSLPALAVWRSAGFQPLAAVKDHTLVVGGDFARRPQDRHMILPISPQYEYPPEELHRLAEHLGIEKIWFVPGQYLDRFGRSAVEDWFEVREQPDYHDYVYHRRDLAELQGGRYAAKRNLVRQFEREYVNPGRVRGEPLTGAAAGECIDFMEAWCRERECDLDDDEDLRCEWQAAVNALENVEQLNVRGLLLRVEGKICAFGIAADLTADMGVLHFQKAFASLKGLYQYFDRCCARRLFNGHVYINKESDMGIEGLQRAKRSYHPAMMVKSYALERR